MKNKMVLKRATGNALRGYILYKINNKMCTAQQLAKEVGLSRSTIFRIKRKGIEGLKEKTKKCSPGRPRKLSSRTERNVIRIFKNLRAENPNFSSVHLYEKSKLQQFGISNRTLRRILHKHGYGSRTTRRKGILLPRDVKHRLAFAKRVKKERSKDFWTKELSFYLDGVSFYYKRNPAAQARAPQTKIWRKKTRDCRWGVQQRARKKGPEGKWYVCL